jgi:outer membrane protein
MRKFPLIFIFLLAQFNLVNANINAAFIDMEKVLSSSKPGSSLLKQLNLLNDKSLKKFQKDEKILKENEKKLISQKNILSNEEFQSNVNMLRLEIKKYNKNKKKIISDFNKLKINNTNKLLKMINSILIKYSDKKSISMIFQKKNLIIGNTKLDITDEIIKIVNNDISEFKIE